MATKRVLVYGGKGALGSVCVNTFKAKGIWVCSVDLAPNESADVNVLVTELNDWEKQDEQVQSRVCEVLAGEKLDAIYCVAGGWAGGNAASKELVKNCNLMWKQSVWSSIISSSLASRYLKEGGLLQLTGAVPALEGTAGMIGYGMAKAAVHQLTKSLACDNSGLPDKSTALAILPVTLDTPMNRKFMPNADHSSWTSLEYVAKKSLLEALPTTENSSNYGILQQNKSLFNEWLNGENRPTSGSLVKMVTKDGTTAIQTE